MTAFTVHGGRRFGFEVRLGFEWLAVGLFFLSPSGFVFALARYDRRRGYGGQRLLHESGERRESEAHPRLHAISMTHREVLFFVVSSRELSWIINFCVRLAGQRAVRQSRVQGRGPDTRGEARGLLSVPVEL